MSLDNYNFKVVNPLIMFYFLYIIWECFRFLQLYSIEGKSIVSLRVVCEKSFNYILYIY